jgi:pimeloyl-ACP methyl ester carboxylesterase
MDAPPIRYARTSDGVDIAYWVVGTGPPLIYLTLGGHAEAVWSVPDYADWLTALSTRVRLVFIDPRNAGLSSDGPGNLTPEAVANDIAAVATALGLETFFRDFEDFWVPFTLGQGSAPGYVAALSPAERERLREAMRARVQPAEDGSIALEDSAWVVRGTRPA